MSAKAAKGSPEQLKHRQAFDRLKLSLRHSTPTPARATDVAAPKASEAPEFAESHETMEPQAPTRPTRPLPSPPDPLKSQSPSSPQTSPPANPANHGVAFAVREPMMCEICQKPTTKWLSYKPEAKTCICLGLRN